MLSDLEIAESVDPAPITDIAAKLDIPEDALRRYGNDKAKIDPAFLAESQSATPGKLILVTAISPTPAGEGKTTTAIGLADALAQRGVRTALALREPSMGPVFGMKGGAAGGGYAQVIPMTDLNLHFTGDFAAIAAAHNLLAAMVDNHLHFGNELGIDPRAVTWRRVLDVNDRALREIVIGLGGRTGGVPRQSGFDIVAASEVMAVFCLARDLEDLRVRLGRIVAGRRFDGTPVTAAELGAAGAMTAILRDALAPNLVQTLEGTPAVVHGGPFGNIAHGCNSVVATRAAMSLADVTVTEAGFGADLGAEKFFDLTCRFGDFTPDLTVVVATIRALKFHGGVEVADLATPDVVAVQAGMPNLLRHLEVLRDVYSQHLVVAINRFGTDTDDEVAAVVDEVAALDVPVAASTHFSDGGTGALALADEVMGALEQPGPELTFAYDDASSLPDKIIAVAQRVYGAGEVTFLPPAARELARLEADGWGDARVCVAKTQYSFATDPTLKGAPRGHPVTIREVRLAAGAGWVVALAGDIMTMPGLPRRPNAEGIDVDGTRITGLY